jgi:transposase
MRIRATGLAVATINPRRVRDFVRDIKNDQLDAEEWRVSEKRSWPLSTTP